MFPVAGLASTGPTCLALDSPSSGRHHRRCNGTACAYCDQAKRVVQTTGWIPLMPELTEEQVGTASWNTRLLACLESAALVPADAVAVLLVGSRALDWQHARSDLDVVIVTTEPWSGTVTDQQPVALTESTIGIVTTAVDGVRCEVKYWTESQIRETLSNVRWPAWDAGNTGQSMSQNESVLVERLPSAVA